MKQKSKPQLTPKEQEILTLLYRFRFLKHHSRILEWLNSLVEQKYIMKFYDKSFSDDPAVYCLDKLGRSSLKNKKEIKFEPLIRVWQEKKTLFWYKDSDIIKL